MILPRGTFWVAHDGKAMPEWASIAVTANGQTWAACDMWVLWLAFLAGVVDMPQQMSLFEELEEVA